MAGQDISFSCDAFGNPNLRFSWTKDGSPVERGIFFAENKRLCIKNMTKAEAGEYKCEANNGIRRKA